MERVEVSDTPKSDARWSTLPGAGSRYPERRCFPRYEINAATEIVEPISKTKLSGHVSQISQSGCYIRVENGLPAKTIFQIRILHDDGAFESWAQVAYLQEGRGMGVAFLRTEPEQRTRLRSWLLGLVASPV
jgi:hypothetical protein